MSWFKKKIIEVDISGALEKGFEKIKEQSLVEVSSLRLEVQSLKNDVATKQRVIDEQKEKLRTQNEADIFLLIKKIEKEILEGKKKDELTSQLSHLANLQNQAAYLGSSLSGRNMLGSIFG